MLTLHELLDPFIWVVTGHGQREGGRDRDERLKVLFAINPTTMEGTAQHLLVLKVMRVSVSRLCRVLVSVD